MEANLFVDSAMRSFKGLNPKSTLLYSTTIYSIWNPVEAFERATPQVRKNEGRSFALSDV